MTKNQLSGIIRSIRQNYEWSTPGGYYKEKTGQGILENLMIDITNELAGCSDKFNRNDFLRRCGQPQYQPQVARRGL